MIKRRVKFSKQTANYNIFVNTIDYLFSSEVNYTVTENYYPVNSVISIIDTLNNFKNNKKAIK